MDTVTSSMVHYNYDTLNSIKFVRYRPDKSIFYGMSSEIAQNKHFGKMEKYRSSEGRVIKVPYKGKLEETLLGYLGGIRSTFT